jgi:glutathione S-transferase
MSSRRLYELVTDDGSSISPYVWRIRYALAHKRLDYKTCGVGFSGIASVGPGTFKTLPVLEDQGRWIVDSWAIASWLDEKYPDRPLIFATPAERSAMRFIEKWLLVEVVTKLFRISVLDIHDRLRPEDRGYFRQSREARLGHSLEVAHDQREPRVAPFRDALHPMRMALRETPFLGGAEPGYGDYMAIGALIWGGTVATLPLLDPDDSLREWVERMLTLPLMEPAPLPVERLFGR